jgi:hypothetical protein
MVIDMSISLKPTEASAVISVSAPTPTAPSEYETRLYLVVPTSATAGQPFSVSGRLVYVDETGKENPVANMSVEIFWNGNKATVATTGSDGFFKVSVTIPNPGKWTVKGVFRGGSYTPPGGAGGGGGGGPGLIAPGGTIGIMPTPIGPIVMYTPRQIPRGVIVIRRWR